MAKKSYKKFCWILIKIWAYTTTVDFFYHLATIQSFDKDWMIKWRDRSFYVFLATILIVTVAKFFFKRNSTKTKSNS